MFKNVAKSPCECYQIKNQKTYCTFLDRRPKCTVNKKFCQEKIDSENFHTCFSIYDCCFMIGTNLLFYKIIDVMLYVHTMLRFVVFSSKFYHCEY